MADSRLNESGFSLGSAQMSPPALKLLLSAVAQCLRPAFPRRERGWSWFGAGCERCVPITCGQVILDIPLL